MGTYRWILALAYLAGCTTFISNPSRHGIVSGDYGIVTQTDIEKNAAIASPVDTDGHPFLVWQCFEIERVRTRCEDMGDYPENGGSSAAPILEIWSDKRRVEFYLPHVWSTERCREDTSSWQKILQVGEPACFSGFFDSASRAVGDLRAIKTRKGRWSYFIGDLERG